MFSIEFLYYSVYYSFCKMVQVCTTPLLNHVQERRMYHFLYNCIKEKADFP